MCEEKSQEYLRDLFKEKEDVEKVDKVILSKLLTQEICRVRLGSRLAGREGRLLDIYNEKPVKISAKVLVPVKEHPRFNFVGKLLGPKGNSLKRLQEDTMTKMAILGKGSIKNKQKEEELRNSSDPKNAHLKEDLHVEILAFAAPAEAYARIALALAEVRKYLIPDSNDEIRQEQMREIKIIKEMKVTGCGQHQDCSQVAPRDCNKKSICLPYQNGDHQFVIRTENSQSMILGNRDEKSGSIASETGPGNFPNMSPGTFPNMSPGSEDEKLSRMSVDSGIEKSPTNMSPESNHHKSTELVSTQMVHSMDLEFENSASLSIENHETTTIPLTNSHPNLVTSTLTHPVPLLTPHTTSSHPRSRSILSKFTLHRECNNEQRQNNCRGNGTTTKILERIIPHTCSKRRSEDRCGYFGLEDESYKPTTKRNK